MQIKIPTYPKKKFTDIFWASHKTDSEVNYDETGKPASSSQTITINPKTGDAIKTIHVESIGIKYAGPFPNPVHLFISQAIDHYMFSECIKTEEFPNQVQRIDNIHSHLKVDLHETSQALNSYIQNRSGCLIMLITAIESYINHVTPNDIQFKEGKEDWGKEEVQRRMNFKDKLKKLIPHIKNNPDFWIANQTDLRNIVDLQFHRNNIIHLKTTTEPNHHQYLNSIERMLEFDLNAAINSTITFMNLVEPNFIEYAE